MLRETLLLQLAASESHAADGQHYPPASAAVPALTDRAPSRQQRRSSTTAKVTMLSRHGETAMLHSIHKFSYAQKLLTEAS